MNRFKQFLGDVGEAICVEANPALAESLQDGLMPVCRVINAAIVGSPDKKYAELHLSANIEASSLYSSVSGAYGTIQSVMVPCVTLAEVLRQFESSVIDLVKLDIEGAEMDSLLMIDKNDLVSVRQVSVEFHDCFSVEMRPEVIEVRKRMRQLGFWEVNANWPHTDDILFLNAGRKELATARMQICVSVARFAFVCRGILLYFARAFSIR